MKTMKDFLVGALLVAVAFSFVACGDDDDVQMIPVSAAVEGSYTGTMTMAFTYGSFDYADKTVVLTANGDNAVNIAFSDDELGFADMTAIPVKRNGDGTISIVETEDVFSMPLHSGGVNEYACLVSGTISEDGTSFSIVFFIPSVMGGTTYTLVPATAE